MNKQGKKIAVIGSGLVGGLLAILLANEGFSVDVYEKRKDPRKDTSLRGRSIALTLSDRGWKALKAAGLEEALRAASHPSYGRMVHQEDATIYPQEYGDGTQAIWTVNRNQLNAALLEKGSATGGVSFFFEHCCDDLDENTGELTVTNSEGTTIKVYDHIIAVDGVFSAIRKKLSEKQLWKFESTVLNFGYKELCIPPNEQGEHALIDHYVHVWPRKNSMLISFPVQGGSFVSTLFLPVDGPDSLETITTPETLNVFFKREYPELIPLMPYLENEFMGHPVSHLTQVQGGPWHHKDKVLLMGDACHAITPFYGMGMNIGFEDCTAFMTLLKGNNYNFEKVFRSLGKIRKPNTDAMTELSYKNFMSIEQSPEPTYHMKWLLERRIWKLLPELWTPAYVLIAFSEIPLQEVPGIKERQERILDELIAAHPDLYTLDDDMLKALVQAAFIGSPATTNTYVS